jgi:glycosyltransferase involved in cell wall biosynthesis
MGFPRVSETFIASEIHRVEQAGVPLELFVIKPVEAREQGTDHPVLDAIRARPEYLPDPRALTKPLRAWRPRDLAPFALVRCLRKHPRGAARAARTALGQALRDRRSRFSGPRKIYIKELVQAIALVDRLDAHPEVRHLHAHFAHGTTTITWLAACITGLPFSFTGHARDIYAPELNPKGWLKRKLEAARFVVTCTEANVAHLRSIAPSARIHLVYHGLSADFTTLLRDGGAPRRNGRLRILGVGRLVAKKGFETLVEACAVLQQRGVPFEALIVGQDDKHGDAIRARIEELRVPVALPGAVGPGKLLDEYRRSVLCMPSKLLPNDRDGIPNVLVEAMAAGAPVVATNVSGIPELVEHEVNGLLIEPEDPQALADALLRLHDDPELTRRLTANARETVHTRFDGARLAQDLAALFAEAIR